MRALIFLLSVILFLSCTSKPVSNVEIVGVKTKGTMRVQDFNHNEDHNLDTTIYSSMNKMRIEAKATMLGISVATMVLTQDKVQAVLPREKKYYEGSADKIFQHLVHVPLKAGLLFKMVFHPRDPFFKKHCTKIIGNGHCAAHIGNAKIEWLPDESEETKTFWISGPGYAITWEFSNEDFSWTPDPAVFELKVPDSFEKDVLK